MLTKKTTTLMEEIPYSCSARLWEKNWDKYNLPTFSINSVWTRDRQGTWLVFFQCKQACQDRMCETEKFSQEKSEIQIQQSSEFLEQTSIASAIFHTIILLLQRNNNNSSNNDYKQVDSHFLRLMCEQKLVTRSIGKIA